MEMEERVRVRFNLAPGQLEPSDCTFTGGGRTHGSSIASTVAPLEAEEEEGYIASEEEENMYVPFEGNDKYSRFEEEEMYTLQEEENEEKKKKHSHREERKHSHSEEEKKHSHSERKEKIHSHLEEEKKMHCHYEREETFRQKHRHYEEVEEKKYTSFGEMDAEEEVSPPQYEMFDRYRFQWNAPLISLSESSENVAANLMPYSPMPMYAGNMFQRFPFGLPPQYSMQMGYNAPPTLQQQHPQPNLQLPLPHQNDGHLLQKSQSQSAAAAPCSHLQRPSPSQSSEAAAAGHRMPFHMQQVP